MRSDGTAPVAAVDLTPKSYVDLRAGRVFTPPAAGWRQYPDHYLSANSTGTPTSGVVCLVPFTIGPQPDAINGLGVNITTAGVLGTNGVITCTAGIYADDGSGGNPVLTAAGLLASGAIATTAAGDAYASLALSGLVGYYWAALYYAYTASTGGTASSQPVFTTLSTTKPLALPSGAAIGTQVRAYYLTGQTGLPTNSPALGYTSGTTCPVLALRAS